MLLPPFELHRPRTISQALALHSRYGDEAAWYAGGTELLLLMKLGMAEPGHLIDLKQIPELDILEVVDGCLTIGAGVTHRRLERDPLVRSVLPVLSDLSRAVANVRVRNVGTLGGNLCFAEPHSDPATLLLVLNAEVEVVSETGRRRILLDRFIHGPLDTSLEPGELMTKIIVPLPAAGSEARYARLALHERPTVNVAAVLSDGRARIAVGAVGGRPVRAVQAEEVLATDSRAIERAVVTASEEAGAFDDNEASAEYKRHLVGVLLRRILASKPGK